MWHPAAHTQTPTHIRAGVDHPFANGLPKRINSHNKSVSVSADLWILCEYTVNTVWMLWMLRLPLLLHLTLPCPPPASVVVVIRVDARQQRDRGIYLAWGMTTILQRPLLPPLMKLCVASSRANWRLVMASVMTCAARLDHCLAPRTPNYFLSSRSAPPLHSPLLAASDITRLRFQILQTGKCFISLSSPFALFSAWVVTSAGHFGWLLLLLLVYCKLLGYKLK